MNDMQILANAITYLSLKLFAHLNIYAYSDSYRFQQSRYCGLELISGISMNYEFECLIFEIDNILMYI